MPSRRARNGETSLDKPSTCEHPPNSAPTAAKTICDALLCPAIGPPTLGALLPIFSGPQQDQNWQQEQRQQGGRKAGDGGHGSSGQCRAIGGDQRRARAADAEILPVRFRFRKSTAEAEQLRNWIGVEQLARCPLLRQPPDQQRDGIERKDRCNQQLNRNTFHELICRCS